MACEPGESSGAFRSEAVAHDGRAALADRAGHRCSACWRSPSASPGSPSSASSSPGCSAARPAAELVAAAARRRSPPSCCAPGSTTSAPCSRTAPRRGCRRRCAARLYDKIVALGPGLVRRRAHRRRDAVDRRRRRAVADLLRPVPAAGHRSPPARRWRSSRFMAFWDVPVATVMLAAALFTLVAPVGGARAHRPRPRARGSARSRHSARNSSTPMQGLPTLKAFGQSGAYGRMLADKARALSDSTFLVLGTSILTRGITDLGCALGAAAALALGAYRVAPRRDEPGGAADRADGRHRDLPPAARVCALCCTRA